MQEMVEESHKDSSYANSVILTQKEVDASKANKLKKKKTIRQLPVYRAACNLCYFVAEIERDCPRKFRCFVDELESISTELLTLISLANECKAQRREYCTNAQCLLQTMMVKLEVLFKLGVMGKDRWQKIKHVADSAIAQIVGWRNSVNMEGMQYEA